MKKLSFIVAFIGITVYLHAQKVDMSPAMSSDYKTAIGIKFYPGALTIKHFINPKTSVEGLLNVWNYGVRFTGLYEFNGEINGVEGLKWFAGPGAHIGFWNEHWKNKYPTRDDGIMIGIDGVLGLDYKIKGAPIDVSVDWQPSFNFIGYNYFEGDWGGLGVRYAF